jgi:hypothetical protein
MQEHTKLFILLWQELSGYVALNAIKTLILELVSVV